MKKSIFLILPAVMLMLASCMDSAGRNGGAGSVRVVLPGSSRDVSGSDRADSYTVSLLKGGKVIESQTAVPGGAVEFNELDAGSYTVDVEATLSGALSGVGSAEVAVTEGETASCSVLMNRVYTADAAVEYIESLEAGSYKVIVAGAIDDGGIEGIKTALNENNINKLLVSLDLGRTTGLSSIGAAKFQNCTALSAIVLPEGIDSIKESAFEGCTSLASVTIPDTVNEIGQFAFRNCSALKSIEIPRGVITIGSDSFNGCTALESIEIPDSVTTIERAAFHECSSLTDVYIPDSVTEIGNQTFTKCSNLKSIVLSAGITSIAEQVFRECTALTSIEIPDGVSEIKSSAFMSCTALETITIPASLTSIGANAFVSCNKLKTVYYSGTKEQWSSSSIESSLASGVTIICSNGNTTTP
ncbi:leucine-rich repeat domain-containing protein [Treponema succinifaciens]|uniref:leucine-rich repeat domain-containing protein n=1 Tax=Treponema succinifaciens TaxID=167 RepID=UPI0023F495AF|nr:leucine-rich repeat domain-containing protein [Treponema succinifaciens]